MEFSRRESISTKGLKLPPLHARREVKPCFSQATEAVDKETKRTCQLRIHVGLDRSRTSIFFQKGMHLCLQRLHNITSHV